MPSINIHTKGVAEEVKNRELNCRKFSSKIDEQLSKERLAKASTSSGMSRLETLRSSRRIIPTIEPMKIPELYKSKTFCRRVNNLVLCN